MYKRPGQCRKEGEDYYFYHPYSRDRNPYSNCHSYDGRICRREWDDGFRYAERRERERRDEEQAEEKRIEREFQMRQQEEDYWAERNHEKEQED